MYVALDLAIGLIVVFLIVSTVCSAIREGLEALLKTRAAYLERGVRELLDDKRADGLAKSLFEHPLLFGLFLGNYRGKQTSSRLDKDDEVAASGLIGRFRWLFARGRNLPSYIPASTFARALLDIVARGPQTDEVSSDPSSAPITVQSLRSRLLNVDSEKVRRVVLHALDTSGGDLDVAKKALEDWFNDAMDRVSGWYKRSTQWIIFFIAFAVASAMNVDTVSIAKHLSRDEGARQAAVAAAEASVGGGSKPTTQQALAVLRKLELPIGWSRDQVPKNGWEWLNRVVGVFVTALAATLGAPFWFDVLNKVMVIRSTVKPREKSPEEASEDRQAFRGNRNPDAAHSPDAPPQLRAALVAPPERVVSPGDVLPPRVVSEEKECCADAEAHRAASQTASAVRASKAIEGVERELPDHELPPARGGVES